MTAHTYYVVGIHGAPTPETAPHGVMWRRDDDSSTTLLALWKYRHRADPWPDEVEWWPAPAPPTEQAPPPEPVKRWRVGASPGRTHARILLDNCDVMTCEDAEDAVYVLNALDRDGVAWGPGRPMEELPETGRVIVLLTAEHGKGDEFYAYSAEVAHKFIGRVRCWWPLPLPGEAQ